MNKYKKLAGNTLIFALGSFGTKLLSFIMIRFYTGCMTTDQFGDADILYQTGNLIYPIITLSMADALIRFGLDKAYDKKKICTAAVAATLGGTVLLGLAMPLLCMVDFYKSYGILLFVFCFFSAFKQLAASFIRARGLVRLYAVDGIMSMFINVVSNIVLLRFLNMGVTGYILSIIISDVLSLAGLIVIAELYKFVDFRTLNKQLFKEMVKYSAPLIPTYILWWVTAASDRWFVKAMVGDHDNGIYSAAYKIPALLLLVTTVFYQAWQMSAIENKDSHSLSKFFGQVYGAYSSLLFIGAAGLIMLVKPLTYLLVDNDPEKNYIFAYHYTPILIIAMVFQCLCQFLSSIYNVRRKSMNSMFTSMIAAVVNVILNILLIPALKVYGAAIATAAAYFACFIVRLFDSRSYVPFKVSYFKLFVNMVVVCYMALVAVTEPEMTYVQLVSLFLITVVFNFDSIISTIKKVLSRRSPNENKTEQGDVQ